MGDYVEGFGNEDARDFGNTLNEIRFLGANEQAAK
jgi:hypothetical protein